VIYFFQIVDALKERDMGKLAKRADEWWKSDKGLLLKMVLEHWRGKTSTD